MSNRKKNSPIIAVCVIAVGIMAMLALTGCGSGDSYEKYATDKYVKLGNYKGLTYSLANMDVTKEDLEARIDSELMSHSTTEEKKDGKVGESDTVKVSYKGTVNGKSFDASDAEDVSVSIGSNVLPGDMESQLVGKNVGDTVNLTVKLPDSYVDKSVRNKDAKYEVKIKSRTVIKKPEYDEKFVKENTDYKSKKEFEESLKDAIKQEKETSARNAARTDLLNQVTESSKIIEYPEELLKEDEEISMKQYKNLAEQYNTKWEDFLKDYMNMTEDELKESIKSNSKAQVKTRLVVYAIANKEKLKISDKEYEKYVDDILKNAGFTEETFKKDYNMSIEEYAKENNFKAQFVTERVQDFLFGNAKQAKEEK